MSNDTNDYTINSIEPYHFNRTSKFGIHFAFERNSKGIYGILINYNLMCAMLVLVASASFLIDPKDSNRAAILVALLLVFATMLSSAKVNLIALPELVDFF